MTSIRRHRVALRLLGVLLIFAGVDDARPQTASAQAGPGCTSPAPGPFSVTGYVETIRLDGYPREAYLPMLSVQLRTEGGAILDICKYVYSHAGCSACPCYWRQWGDVPWGQAGENFGPARQIVQVLLAAKLQGKQVTITGTPVNQQAWPGSFRPPLCQIGSAVLQ